MIHVKIRDNTTCSWPFGVLGQRLDQTITFCLERILLREHETSELLDDGIAAENCDLASIELACGRVVNELARAKVGRVGIRIVIVMKFCNWKTNELCERNLGATSRK